MPAPPQGDGRLGRRRTAKSARRSEPGSDAAARASSPTSSRSRPRGACRPSDERYAQRLASTMDEMQAFYDATFPRAEDAIAYLDSSRSTTCPRTRSTCCTCCTRSSWCRSRSRLEAAPRPRLRRRLPRPRRRADVPMSGCGATRPPRRTPWVDVDAGRACVVARRGRGRGRPHRDVNPAHAPRRRRGDRARRHDAAARPHGHGAQLPDGRAPRREPAQRRPGRPRVHAPCAPS